MAAFVMARKAGNLAADDEVVQRFALLQHLFSQQVQGGYIDVVGHASHLPCRQDRHADGIIAGKLAGHKIGVLASVL